MNVLCIDAATEYSGILVVSNGQAVEWNVLRSVGVDVWDRVDYFGKQLNIELQKNNIDILGYEYPSGNKGHSVNLKMGYLLGTAIRVHRIYNVVHPCKMFFVKPMQVKKTGAHKDAPIFAGQQIGVEFTWKSEAEKKRLGNVWDAIGIWLYLKGQGVC